MSLSLTVDRLYKLAAESATLPSQIEPVAPVVAKPVEPVTPPPKPVDVNEQFKQQTQKDLLSSLDQMKPYAPPKHSYLESPEGKAWYDQTRNDAFWAKADPRDEEGNPAALTPQSAASRQALLESLSNDTSPLKDVGFTRKDRVGETFKPADVLKEFATGPLAAAKFKPDEYEAALAKTRPAALLDKGKQDSPLYKGLMTKIVQTAEAGKTAEAVDTLRQHVDLAEKNNPAGVTDWLTKNWQTLMVPGGLLLAAFGGHPAFTMIGLAAAGYGGYNLYGRYKYLNSAPGTKVMQMAAEDAAKGKIRTPERMAQLEAMGDSAKAAYEDGLMALKVGYLRDMMKDKAYDAGTAAYSAMNPGQAASQELLNAYKAKHVLPNEQRRAAEAAAASAAAAKAPVAP